LSTEVFYAVSRPLALFASPGNLLCLLVLLAALASLARRQRLAGRLLGAAAIGFLACAIVPLGVMLGRPLETRFPANPPLPARIDGIVVLGGGQDPDKTAAFGRPFAQRAAGTLAAMAELARAHPEARVIFVGGRSEETGLSESDIARRHLAYFGMDLGAVVFDDASRNTRDNALRAVALAAPKPGETWVLITRALHMPRAMAAFAKAGLPCVPFPVDLRTSPEAASLARLDVAQRLVLLDDVLHEIVGLLAYRLAGYA
jgi:uncharacterized SAM-binding protein YcdF (DUF218 family)